MAKRDKNIPIGDERQRPIPGKKNKKKWCRGKVGVPHTPEPMKVDRWWAKGKKPDWWELVCTSCGKRLAFYYPMPWGTFQDPPDWVPCDDA